MQRQIHRAVSDADKHHLIGNALCLDFANTLYGHRGTPLHEYLCEYRDLVLWSRHAGILDITQAEKLARLAALQPDHAARVFRHALAIRELIFRIFSALASGKSPNPADLTALNAARAEVLAHSTINRTQHGFSLDWDEPGALDRMLWDIVLSAADLLTSERVGRVRECSGDACDWLFVDTSRNHMRRWCLMSVCGNRAKAHRFLRKRRTVTTQP